MSTSIRTSLGTLVAAASGLTVVTYLVALLLSVGLLLSTSIGQELSQRSAIVVIGAFLIETPLPLRFNALISYIGFFLVMVACFIEAFRDDGGLLADLRRLVGSGEVRQIRNWFAAMPLISSPLLLGIVFFTMLLNSLGLPTGSLPRVPAYQLLYGLARAPVVEEIAFRITTLGVLVSFRAFWRSNFPPGTRSGISSIPDLASKTRLLLLGLLFPDRAKSRAGLASFRSNGWQGIHVSEWLLLIVTSAGFGLAHPLAGGGWGPGKALSAALQGLVIGISYLLFGAYAAILFHWYFDIYFYVFSFTPLAVQSIVILLIYITTIIGSVAFVTGTLRRKKKETDISTNGLYPPSTKLLTLEFRGLHHRQVK